MHDPKLLLSNAARKVLVLASSEQEWRPLAERLVGDSTFICSYFLVGQLPELIGQDLLNDYDVCLLLNIDELSPLYKDAIFVVSHQLPLLIGASDNAQLPYKLNHLVLDGVVLGKFTSESLRQRIDYVIGSHTSVTRSYASQQRNEYLANAFQELKTSLTSILGFVGRIETKQFGFLPEKVQGAMKMIRWSADYAVDIVSDASQFIELDTKKEDAERSKCDVNTLIEEVIGDVQFVLRRNDTKVFFRPKGDVCFFELYVSCMKYALVNLLVEMIEHCTEVSIVNSSLQKESGSNLQIYFHGIRKAEDELPEHKPGYVKKATGTAFLPQKPYVGIALVRQVVDMHGGSVQIDDTKDKLIEVMVTIPYSGFM
ncbi:MAG: hypothetical protein COA99_10745 [Moraxellaceae bacterium]|nr:MAG: hypothetical protein COA99_10745 [Moraxellaceae bacterium]